MKAKSLAAVLFISMVFLSFAFSLTPFVTSDAMAGSGCGTGAPCQYEPHTDWYRAPLAGPDCCCVHISDQTPTCW